jgi:tripartite-type tricarboxylate transporter receptor subunit TctC
MASGFRVAVALLVLIGAAQAQQGRFPSAPVTVVLPFAAGGSADVAMRLYGDVFSRNTGQRLIIENRAGGGGTVAAMAVKAARPDGYTLRLADVGTDAILPAMQSVPYDPFGDFRPITVLMSWPQFLVVPSSSPAGSVAGLAQFARTKPGGLNHGSQGVGSGGHLLGAMFQLASGAPLVHVPYKGGGPLALDLMTGRVDLAFTSYREARAALADGKVKVLAAAAAHRAAALPHVPTMAEAGYAGVELAPWFALVAPAGTPDGVIERLHEELTAAAKDPALIRRLGDDAIELNVGSPPELAALIASDRERLAKVIKAVGIRPE